MNYSGSICFADCFPCSFMYHHRISIDDECPFRTLNAPQSSKRSSSTMLEKRMVLLCMLQALRQTEAHAEGPVVIGLAEDEGGMAIVRNSGDNRHGTKGRRWIKLCNAQTFFFEYALRPDVRESVSCKAIFRVPHAVFRECVAAMGSEVTAAVTMFRNPLPPELKVAAMLMHCGEVSCETVATQLGVVTSTFNLAVKKVSNFICSILKNKVQFPSSEQELASVMRGFKELRGIPN